MILHINITNNILQKANRKTTITDNSDKKKSQKINVRKNKVQVTRERRQQTYELIETVLRRECSLTLPQEFLCSNQRITFHGHTGGFEVRFHL